MEKYLTLAREASTSGDRIVAEGFFQHAEHYFRVMNANGRDPDDREDRPQSEHQHQPQPTTAEDRAQPDPAENKPTDLD